MKNAREFAVTFVKVLSFFAIILIALYGPAALTGLGEVYEAFFARLLGTPWAM